MCFMKGVAKMQKENKVKFLPRNGLFINEFVMSVNERVVKGEV